MLFFFFGFVFLLTNAVKLDAIEAFNSLNPISDQDRISPYNFNTIPGRQVTGIKKNISSGINYQLIQYQILQTKIVRILWQTVRRITGWIEILGVKGVWEKPFNPLLEMKLQVHHSVLS